MTNMKLYKIAQADPDTGLWLSEPEYIGEIGIAAHLARKDTEAVHYDEVDPAAFDGFGDGTENVAIEVHWISE
jgi:hypothetical protein